MKLYTNINNFHEIYFKKNKKIKLLYEYTAPDQDFHSSQCCKGPSSAQVSNILKCSR